MFHFANATKIDVVKAAMPLILSDDVSAAAAKKFVDTTTGITSVCSQLLLSCACIANDPTYSEYFSTHSEGGSAGESKLKSKLTTMAVTYNRIHGEQQDR